MSQSVLNLYQHVLLKRAKTYHLWHCFHLLLIQVNNSSSFRSLVICFANDLVNICVVFVWPYRNLFTILESGNMMQNSLAAWSEVLKGRLCSTRKPEKSSSVDELAPKLVSFPCCCAASTYLLSFEVSLCLLISFSPPCTTLKSLPQTVRKAKPSPCGDFWLNLNLLLHESLNFRQYFFFFECFDFFSPFRFDLILIKKRA